MLARWPLHLLSLLMLLLAGGAGSFAQEPSKNGVLLELEGVVGPAMADYFERGLSQAEEAGAQLVILRMDTPGGLDTSMRLIIKRIISAQVPVITYVAPGGARAASAGTYILYASHVAAMAPGTNLGAATPVSLGGSPGQEPEKGPEKGQGSEKENPPDEDQGKAEPEDPGVGQPASSDDSKRRKVVNDAAAYIRGLAQMRGRNAEWAEAAVRQAVSLSAKDALEKGVIEVLASDVDSLLKQLDGRQVELQMGSRQLETAGLSLEIREPDWRSKLLAIITHPNVAYILMLVGIYGIIYEFVNPGAIVPGVAGVISLLLAFYAFQLLPVNYAGMALILLGLALMAAEAIVPSFGALGIGGVASFTIGSLMLIDTDHPSFGISVPMIITLAVSSALLLVIIVRMAMRSHRNPVVSGKEEMVGAIGTARDDFSERGSIRVHGEVWDAHTDQPVHADQSVRVIARKGLVLEVTPINKEEESS